MRILTPVLLAALVGCGGKEQTDIRPVEPDAAAALNADHSKFESSQDPPFKPQTHFAAGQLAESQGAFGAAIEQYTAVVKLDPRHQPSLYRLGVLYTQARRYDNAIEAWKQYVRATNGSATAYSNLAFSYELSGQIGEAEQAYQQGIKREPQNQPCRINYGLMLARLGRRDDAIAQLSTVLAPAGVHYNLASVYEQIGRKDLARPEYQRALELDPRMWEAQQRLSRLDD